jgi:hypothetical protein
MAEKSSLRDKIFHELDNAGMTELADAIDQLKSDQDVREYIWANRGFYQKKYDNETLNAVPNFRDMVYGSMPGSPIDLDKQFGKDWDKDFGNISYNKIEYEAQKAGLDPKKLIKDMEQEATRRERYRIANEGAAAKVTKFLFPRGTEAVEQGRSPEAGEVALDVGQNLLYAVPWTRALTPLANASKLGRVGTILASKPSQVVIGNTTAPLLSEVGDQAYYDDPENPRSEFSWGDVGTGAVVNATTPWMLRGVLRGASRATSSNLLRAWSEMGLGETSPEMTKRILEELRVGAANAYKDKAKLTKYQLDAVRKFMALSPEAQSVLEQNGSDLIRLAEQPGKTIEEKFSNLVGKGEPFMLDYDSRRMGTNKGKVLSGVTPKAQKTFKELGLEETLNAKSAASLAGDEALKNFLTNKYGDYGYRGDPLQRIPFAGDALAKENKKSKEEEELRKKEEALYKKWGIRFDGR